MALMCHQPSFQVKLSGFNFHGVLIDEVAQATETSCALTIMLGWRSWMLLKYSLLFQWGCYESLWHPLCQVTSIFSAGNIGNTGNVEKSIFRKGFSEPAKVEELP